MKHRNLDHPDRDIVTETMALNVLTLTGTTGTATVTVDGQDYLATFATSLTVTAANFVIDHAEALLKRGITVTADTGVLTFTRTVGHVNVSIANLTTDLSGTLTSIYTPDMDAGRIFRLTSQAAFTIAAPIHPIDGGNITLEITAGGTHAITWNAAYQFAGGTEPTQTASGLDIHVGRYNKAAGKVYIHATAADVKA